jgi:uncharacterized protein YdgA (DUF945 family)
MKKAMIIGAVGVVAVVGYFGVSPIVVSKMMEKNFSTVTANVAKESNIEIQDISYDASLTGATAYTTLYPLGPTQEPRLKVKHEISTLPFYTKTDGSSGLAAAYIKSTLSDDDYSSEAQEQIKTAFNEQTPVLLETVVDYRGNYHLTLTVNPAEIQENQQTLKFSGLTGQFTVSKDGGRVAGNAHFQSLHVNSADGDIQLADFRTTTDQSKNNAGLWIGTSDFSIDNIITQTPMGEFNIKQVNMQADAIDQTQTLDYLLKFVIKEILSPEGFPLAINSVDFDMKINKIDSAAAADLLQALEDLQKQLQASTPQAQQQLAEQFNSADHSKSIEQLLRANPTMSQRLFVQTAQGPVNLDLELNITGFPDEQTLAGLQSGLYAPVQLIQYLDGNLKAKAPLAILLMTPLAAQLEAYQQQGLLKIEGDTATVEAVLKNNQLTLNGQSIPMQF